MELSLRFDGKKFMWDGKVYPDRKPAREAAQHYQADGFQVQLVEEGGQFFLFTRREVREVVVEAKPS